MAGQITDLEKKPVKISDSSTRDTVGGTGDVLEGKQITTHNSSTAEDNGDKAQRISITSDEQLASLRQIDLGAVPRRLHAVESASLVHDFPEFTEPPVPPVTSAPLERRTNILQSAGVYEVELNWQGESELRKFKQSCKKHPNHEQFIPVSEFAENHLPALYRNNFIIDLVNCLSTLTVRLRVDKISLSRPSPPYPPSPRFDKFGRDCSINGTGHVSSAVVCLGGADNWEGASNSDGTDNLCACTECLESGIPVQRFGKIFIQTAAHVVHDDTEAANTTCFFNYVNDNDDLETIIKIQGTKGVQTDVTEDRCWMFFYTHDLSLVKKLKYTTDKYQNLRKEVSDKYCVNWSDEPEEKLTIIVSHPHGCSKCVTIGNMEGRLAAQDDEDWTQYTYTTATCPGSSGAPIFMLGKHGYLDNHHHSGTVPDTGLNVSTFGLF